MSEKAISISEFFGSAVLIDTRTAKVAKEAGQAAAKELRKPFYGKVRLGEFNKHSLSVMANTRELHVRETTISRRIQGFRNDTESLPDEYGLKILFTTGELINGLAKAVRNIQNRNKPSTSRPNLSNAKIFDITDIGECRYTALSLPTGVFKINLTHEKEIDDVLVVNIYPDYMNKHSKLFLPSTSVARMEGDSGSLWQNPKFNDIVYSRYTVNE